MKKLFSHESFLNGIKNRILQHFARNAWGSTSVRVWLHRLRGVKIGRNVFIGTDALLDTSHPYKIVIGNKVVVGIRVTLIAHFDNKGDELLKSNKPSLVIEDEVFLGPGVIVLPNLTIGKGAVVTAGSVVTKSVPPYTMVQGNPAQPVAKCGISLTRETSMWEFYKKLKLIKKNKV
ncbi:MAG: acyltransferase [Spirochaetes bacterium]|nr:acyltransferase [Spirochaetota bacterium]